MVEQSSTKIQNWSGVNGNEQEVHFTLFFKKKNIGGILNNGKSGVISRSEF
jgi:hypothetical protein